jgi:hypothetical protein
MHGWSDRRMRLSTGREIVLPLADPMTDAGAMPKSRKRRNRVRPAARDVVPPQSTRGGQGLEALITPEVIDELDLSLSAEAAGNVEEAIRHFERSPLADSAPHLRYLREVRDLGAEAPGWVWSRWVLEQTHRWLCLHDRERIHEAGVVTLQTVYRDVDPHLPLGRRPKDFAAQIMAIDWMCRQVALYELGGLARYLETTAQAPLLRRADRIMAWPAAPMRALRIEDAARGEVTLTDLSTGGSFPVLNVGQLLEGLGCCVVGRLVPIRSEPGWIFDSCPRQVSDAVAEEIAHSSRPLDWTTVLGEAVVAGELDWPLESVACLTPLSSDLPAYTWVAPAGELSETAFEVCAASLAAAPYSERAARQTAPYAAAVLMDSQVYDAARQRLTGPEHVVGWEALASNTHEPVRRRCLDLAARSRAAA